MDNTHKPKSDLAMPNRTAIKPNIGPRLNAGRPPLSLERPFSNATRTSIQGEFELLSTYQRILSTLFTMLIVSLPFFSVRNSVVLLSPPLVLLLLICGVIFLRSLLITFKLPISISFIDICVVAYVALIVVNLAMLPNAEGSVFALGKTVIYVVSYFCLKMLMRDLTLKQIANSAGKGALIGTFLFMFVAASCVILSGRLGEFTTFTYSSVTGTIFQAIDQVLGSGADDSFESRDIMRNSVAEAFTLFFLLSMVFKYENPTTSFVVRVANVMLTIITFSRRAFYGIAIVIAGSSMKDTDKLKRGIGVAVVVLSVVALSLLFQERASDSRLLDLSGHSRVEMISEGFRIFTDSPLLGAGFGTKLERGSYIHNFVIGSAAMMGIGGVAVSLTIFMWLSIQFIRSLLDPRIINAGILLIIPIIGMSVGSTFEGITTISSWIAIALYSVCEEKQTKLQV